MNKGVITNILNSEEEQARLFDNFAYGIVDPEAYIEGKPLIQHFAEATDWSIEDQRQFIRMIQLHGADIDARDRDGKTLLHHAVEAENVDMAEFCVKHGADLHARDLGGKTPYEMLEGNPKLQHVEELADRKLLAQKEAQQSKVMEAEREI